MKTLGSNPGVRRRIAWRNIAETSLRQGHHVSAREAFFRASNYYRTAEFFRRRDPANDPEVTRLSDRSRETFVAAAKLSAHPLKSLRSHMKIRLFPATCSRLMIQENPGLP